MNSDRNMIYYACIAKGTTILAEFNSKDADLGSLALKCLDKTPSHHAVFSHTIRNRTYLFLIVEPFSYFAIFDENLDNSEGLAFLKSVKDAFNDIAEGNSEKRRLESLSSHCFQGEFNPVFHQLLVSNEELEGGLHSPDSGHNRTGNETDFCILPTRKKPVKKKKKRFLLGDCVGGSPEMKIGLTRELSVVMQKNGGGLYSGKGEMGKKIWKKHVWVVLSMDLIICTILFIVWLCICRGFKCIDD